MALERLLELTSRHRGVVFRVLSILTDSERRLSLFQFVQIVSRGSKREVRESRPQGGHVHAIGDGVRSLAKGAACAFCERARPQVY